MSECSRLKSAGMDGNVVDTHDKDHTAGCDESENKFLKFCSWHDKPSS